MKIEKRNLPTRRPILLLLHYGLALASSLRSEARAIPPLQSNKIGALLQWEIDAIKLNP